MPTTMIGLRIRERRRAAGLRQVELAERMGISASYLNLIEREKRRASPDLAARAARALGVDPSELDGAVERRLADRMAEIPEIGAERIERAFGGGDIGPNKKVGTG